MSKHFQWLTMSTGIVETGLVSPMDCHNYVVWSSPLHTCGGTVAVMWFCVGTVAVMWFYLVLLWCSH